MQKLIEQNETNNRKQRHVLHEFHELDSIPFIVFVSDEGIFVVDTRKWKTIFFIIAGRIKHENL